MSGFDVFDIDGVAGHFAIYTEPAIGAGDAPLYDPLAHLDLIKVHSGMAYVQVAMEQNITIAHPRVNRPSSSWDWSTWSNNWHPKVYSVDRLLFAHNLGYVPFLIWSIDRKSADPGIPVQVNSGGGTRYLQVYATETEVRALEEVDTGNGDLLGVTITYDVMVLREPSAGGSEWLFEAVSDRIQAGEGWFDSDLHYLRAVAPGESPFSLAGSQNIDTEGGICRAVAGDGTFVYDFYQPADYTGSLTSVVTQEVMR